MNEMVRKELYVDEFESEIEVSDNSYVLFSDESDIKTIDSVTPDELLVNSASLEPLYGRKYSKVDHVKFVEASL